MTEQELSVRNKQEVTAEEGTRPGRSYVPDVDIYETPELLQLWADMPGVDDKSVSIHLADGVLTIEGQVGVKEYEHLAPVYTEYNVGNYSRRFTLGNDVDTDKITAKVTNGVLELHIPKSERAKPRRINVTAG
jgi:HSP20 family molecular chaperone IbpA